MEQTTRHVRIAGWAFIVCAVMCSDGLGVEITQTMTIDGEQFSMLRFEVERGSFMEGKTIGALQEDEDIDIVLHGNGGGVDVHPDNTIVVHAGDTLVLFAHHNKINSIVARNRG